MLKVLGNKAVYVERVVAVVRDDVIGGGGHNPPPTHGCTTITLRSSGGDGAFRFMNNIGNVKVFRGSDTFQTCNKGIHQIEIGKRMLGTDVSIIVNGRVYRYPANSGYDKHINNWFRRYFNIRL